MGRRSVFRVENRSMLPTLHPGDRVFVDTGRPAEIGAIVVARFPDGRCVVKRLASRGAATFALASDNPSEATDSRELGSFEDSALIGVVALTWPWR